MIGTRTGRGPAVWRKNEPGIFVVEDFPVPPDVRSVALIAVMLWSVPAYADPCGMVPPMWSLDIPQPIQRVGPQKTYVFFKDGLETFVIRPAFSGKIDEFGMLIPFPSPPAIRKVSDDIFDHIAKAVDPSEMTVQPPDPLEPPAFSPWMPSAALCAP